MSRRATQCSVAGVTRTYVGDRENEPDVGQPLPGVCGTLLGDKSACSQAEHPSPLSRAATQQYLDQFRVIVVSCAGKGGLAVLVRHIQVGAPVDQDDRSFGPCPGRQPQGGPTVLVARVDIGAVDPGALKPSRRRPNLRSRGCRPAGAIMTPVGGRSQHVGLACRASCWCAGLVVGGARSGDGSVILSYSRTSQPGTPSETLDSPRAS
jgi:hypothetical protein